MSDMGSLPPHIVGATVCLVIFMAIVLPVTAAMYSLIPDDGIRVDNEVGPERAVQMWPGRDFTERHEWRYEDGALTVDGRPLDARPWILYSDELLATITAEGELTVVQARDGYEVTGVYPDSRPVVFQTIGRQIRVYDDTHLVFDGTCDTFILTTAAPSLGAATYGLAAGDPAAVLPSGFFIAHLEGSMDSPARAAKLLPNGDRAPPWYDAAVVTYDGSSFQATGQSSRPPTVNMRLLTAQTSELEEGGETVLKVDSVSYDGSPMQGWWVPLGWSAPGEPSMVATIVGMVPVVLLAGLVSMICAWAVGGRRAGPSPGRTLKDGWSERR